MKYFTFKNVKQSKPFGKDLTLPMPCHAMYRNSSYLINFKPR